MAWETPFHNCVRFKTGQRILQHCFRAVVPLIALVLCGPSMVTANEAERLEIEITYNPDIRPFTTAEIRTVLYLIDQAKQYVDPEYYLSEEYLNEKHTTPDVLRRKNLRQQKWEQAAHDRQRARKQRINERETHRVRLRNLRAQEYNIQRIQRHAQRVRRQQEFCAWRQNRAQFSQHMHRNHPRCRRPQARRN